jgi:hypothetical protein
LCYVFRCSGFLIPNRAAAGVFVVRLVSVLSSFLPTVFAPREDLPLSETPPPLSLFPTTFAPCEGLLRFESPRRRFFDLFSSSEARY